MTATNTADCTACLSDLLNAFIFPLSIFKNKIAVLDKQRQKRRIKRKWNDNFIVVSLRWYYPDQVVPAHTAPSRVCSQFSCFFPYPAVVPQQG